MKIITKLALKDFNKNKKTSLAVIIRNCNCKYAFKHYTYNVIKL